MGWIDIETGTWGGDINTLRAVSDDVIIHLSNEDESDSTIKEMGLSGASLTTATRLLNDYFYLPAGTADHGRFTRAVTDANLFERDIRIFSNRNFARYKIGSEMWSLPIQATYDPQRDL